MGHIVNPILFRLGLNRIWNSSWSSFNQINYAYLIQRDLFIYDFLKLFFRDNIMISQGFLYSHTKILKVRTDQFNIINYIFNHRFNKFFKKFIPFIHLLLFRISVSVFKLRTLSINNNNVFKSNNIIFIFLNKFYCFVIYYIYNNIYLKPLFYALKLLNLILYKWLLMISPQFCNYEISYVFLNLNQVTPQVITFYITTKLKRRHLLFKILRPIFFNLQGNDLLLGYKISCSGRFTRKQRATYLWFNHGLVPFNRVDSVIDYSYRQIPLRFGICGIKVWLCREI